MRAQEQPVAWGRSPASAPMEKNMHPSGREASSLYELSHIISKSTPVWDFIFSLEDLFMTSQLLGIPTPPNPWGTGKWGHCAIYVKPFHIL